MDCTIKKSLFLYVFKQFASKWKNELRIANVYEMYTRAIYIANMHRIYRFQCDCRKKSSCHKIQSGVNMRILLIYTRQQSVLVRDEDGVYKLTIRISNRPTQKNRQRKTYHYFIYIYSNDYFQLELLISECN